MMDLASDLRIQCTGCRKRLYVSKENYEPYIYSEEHHNMGLETIYCIEDTVACPYCGTTIEYSIFGSEYPPGGYNNEWFDISGGRFVVEPHMDVEYDYYEVSQHADRREAYEQADDIQRIILDIAERYEEVFSINSREFEMIVERLYQGYGFKTELTPRTRDGGKDIIARKYFESPLPFVRYIECKQFTPPHTVGEPIIRGLHGVLADGRINQAVLVTSSYFTQDAIEYTKRQGTLIELVDGERLKKMIQREAKFYYSRFL